MIDPQAAAYLARLGELGIRPIEALTPGQLREQTEKSAPALFGPVEEVASVIDRDADGVRVRVYEPDARDGDSMLLWLHGGGWVACSLDTHDGPCRALANRTGWTVVSVDYRRAPENHFPAALEDAWRATQWVARRARQVVVGGDSSGGNLAAAVAVRARDHDLSLSLQVLVNPILDHDFSRPSYTSNAIGKGLTRDAMRWYWEHYLGLAESSNPEASPLRTSTLTGLAPALIVVCGHDPLRDEGIDFATRLRQFGVPVQLTEYDDMIHGFIRMAAVIDRTQELLDECAAAVRRLRVDGAEAVKAHDANYHR